MNRAACLFRFFPSLFRIQDGSFKTDAIAAQDRASRLFDLQGRLFDLQGRLFDLQGRSLRFRMLSCFVVSTGDMETVNSVTSNHPKILQKDPQDRQKVKVNYHCSIVVIHG